MGTGAGKPALRATHGFRQSCRTGREDEQKQVVFCYWLVGNSDRLGCDFGGVFRRVDQEHLVGGDARCHPLQQRRVHPGRHQYLAVRVAHEHSQLVSAVGGVDPHHDTSGKRRRCQPEDVIGHVVQQNPDMRRTLGIKSSVEQRATAGCFLHQLPIRPHLVVELQCNGVAVRTLAKDVGNCRHGSLPPNIDINIVTGDRSV